MRDECLTPAALFGRAGRRAVIRSRRQFLVGFAAVAAGAIVGPGASIAATEPERDRIRALVAGEARAMRFSAPLALAVAHAESYFDPAAESSKGARGVMQIMPATARGEYGIEPDLLWDPRINVRLGVHFLGRLMQRYRGRTDLALSYYNGGSRVGSWPDAHVLPATRSYVNRVRNLESEYRRRMWGGNN